VVVSVGNEGGPVSAPANCSGVLGVAGLRHAGTKVGFSNLGSEVGLGAPGGNCVNTGFGQPCLFSLITTSNSGTTAPGSSTYTNSINFNVGTSFSAPLAASAAALIHAVNSRLSTSQVIALLKETSRPFPTSSDPGVPVCRVPTGASDLQTSECSCTTQTCGTGMLDANAAVLAALHPFASAQGPSVLNPGSSEAIDGTASSAANNRSIVSYQWTTHDVVGATPSIVDPTAASTSIQVSGNSQFTLRLTITDDAGAQDVDELAVSTPLPPNVTPSAPPTNGGGGGGGGHIGWQLLCALLLLSRLSIRGSRSP
jgi:serine protease